MKSRTLIVLMALGLVLSAAPALRGSEAGPEEMIAHARDVVLDPNFSCDAITKALVEVLDASLLILPKTDYADEFKSRIGTVRTMFGENELFADKIHQYLGLAYKLVSGGTAWQVPEELTSAYREKDIMAQAKKICLKHLDSALADRKAGRNEQAVLQLLAFVLMVVTPVEA